MSDDWKEVVEDGQVYFIHDEHGTVIKLTDDSYIACMAKIVKFGPLSSLENAKSVLVWKKEELDEVLEEFNKKIMK